MPMNTRTENALKWAAVSLVPFLIAAAALVAIGHMHRDKLQRAAQPLLGSGPKPKTSHFMIAGLVAAVAYFGLQFGLLYAAQDKIKCTPIPASSKK